MCVGLAGFFQSLRNNIEDNEAPYGHGATISSQLFVKKKNSIITIECLQNLSLLYKNNGLVDIDKRNIQTG